MERLPPRTDSNDAPHYRYKLNDKAPADRMGVEGVTLTKDWTPFKYKLHDKLHHHIRSPQNPEGMIDYEEFIPGKNLTKDVVVDSPTSRADTPLKFYTRDQLGTMNLMELREIGKYYGIDPVNKKEDWMRKKIIEKQREKFPDEDLTVNPVAEAPPVEKTELTTLEDESAE